MSKENKGLVTNQEGNLLKKFMMKLNVPLGNTDDNNSK